VEPLTSAPSRVTVWLGPTRPAASSDQFQDDDEQGADDGADHGLHAAIEQ
jgi:hypothetical protein